MNAFDIEILSTLKVKIESTQIKSQDNRPSPEKKRKKESCANLRIPPRVCDVEGGAVCSSTFVYFDGTARGPRTSGLLPSLGPGSAEVEKSKKRGQIGKNIGERSEPSTVV